MRKYLFLLCYDTSQMKVNIQRIIFQRFFYEKQVKTNEQTNKLQKQQTFLYFSLIYILYQQQLNRMQILKDYHLCQDLTRLNHDDYFHINFQTPQLYQALCSPNSPSQLQQQSRNRCIYFLNLSHTQDKNVFIVLKWLLIAHQITKGARHSRVIREMEEAMGKVSHPKSGSKYQKYLYERLMRPYKQYLQKLCHLMSGEARGGSKREPVQVWFMKYNLLKLTLYELCPLMGEFMPFFQENYPFLCKISQQVGLDAERMMKELKNGYKSHQFKYVQRHQLQLFEQQITKMREYIPSDQTVESFTFTESEFCQNKIQNFFESASKVQCSILFA